MSSVADPDPGSGAFLTPGSGSGMNNPGHISESLKTIYWVKNTYILCYGSGMEKSRIREEHPGSATIGRRVQYLYKFLYGVVL